jgi:hypothetical protein
LMFIVILNHPGKPPAVTVERFGHGYYCRGCDKTTGILLSEMKRSFFTKDKEVALKTAKSRIEQKCQDCCFMESCRFIITLYDHLVL